MRDTPACISALLLVAIGCSQKTATEDPAPDVEKVTISVTSPAFASGGCIPLKYTGEGEDFSPPLAWTGLPAGAVELALICEDPDAPGPEPWVHWVRYNIPAGTSSLMAEVTGEALEGTNSWGTMGYRGPMPPVGHGVHRYRFRIYALDAGLDLPTAATKKELLEAMEGHVLATGELIGTYERKR
jgi:Raf kinase inhibitor-like YbhB/YbcL family protein